MTRTAGAVLYGCRLALARRGCVAAVAVETSRRSRLAAREPRQVLQVRKTWRARSPWLRARGNQDSHQQREHEHPHQRDAQRGGPHRRRLGGGRSNVYETRSWLCRSTSAYGVRASEAPHSTLSGGMGSSATVPAKTLEERYPRTGRS